MKNLPYISLLLSAIIYGLFGIAFLIYPQMIEMSGISITDSVGNIEIRSFYGGLEIGIALFFAIFTTLKHWYLPALTLQIMSFGGLAIGRMLGIIICGYWTPLIFGLIVAEILGVLIGLLAFKQMKNKFSVNNCI